MPYTSLGVMAPTYYDDNGDPVIGDDPRIYLTPTVINTSGPVQTPPVLIQPVSVDNMNVPQTLPDLVAHATAVPWGMLVALAALAYVGLRKGSGTKGWD